MEVGQVQDAQAVQRRRQAHDRHLEHALAHPLRLEQAPRAEAATAAAAPADASRRPYVATHAVELVAQAACGRR